MAFSDRIGQADGITITLSCGLCNQPADENHACVKRYLRNPKVVLIRQLAPPDSNADSDLFLVKTLNGDEEYTTTRAVLKRDYEEI